MKINYNHKLIIKLLQNFIVIAVLVFTAYGKQFLKDSQEMEIDGTNFMLSFAWFFCMVTLILLFIKINFRKEFAVFGVDILMLASGIFHLLYITVFHPPFNFFPYLTFAITGFAFIVNYLDDKISYK